MTKYLPARKVNTKKVQVRGLQYAVHTWGDPNGRPLMMLHGWADSGLSFQFLADAMSDNWYLIAPDWRGFGDSEWNTHGYWFPDYLADLDQLIERYSPDQVITEIASEVFFKRAISSTEEALISERSCSLNVISLADHLL